MPYLLRLTFAKFLKQSHQVEGSSMQYTAMLLAVKKKFSLQVAAVQTAAVLAAILIINLVQASSGLLVSNR